MNNPRLVRAYGQPDITCMYCNQGMIIDEWYTEYGDPVEGERIVSCIGCGAQVLLTTHIEVHYTVKNKYV